MNLRVARLIFKALELSVIIFLGGKAAAEGLSEQEFTDCKQSVYNEAREQKFSTALLDSVFPHLVYRHRVVSRDRSQPEFVQSPFDYISRRINAAKVQKGRVYYKKYADFLRQLTRRYGVPGQYLIAFWGMETSFGGYTGKTPTFDALITLSCDRRRSRFFRKQFFSALDLLQRDGLDPSKMKGSWAGALGQTQFMPSVYLRYGVDGDDDGKIDLWRSHRDALASAANYLAALGWRTGERWGREIVLPQQVAWPQFKLDEDVPVKTWQQLGVKMAIGQPLPSLPMPGRLLLPLGHKGPAFLAYPNFRVILRWNRSIAYGLAIGYFADQIAGQNAWVANPGRAEQLSSEDLVQTQQYLIDQGRLQGKADGVLGPATRRAVRQFQLDSQLAADGFPDKLTREKMASRQPGEASIELQNSTKSLK